MNCFHSTTLQKGKKKKESHIAIGTCFSGFHIQDMSVTIEVDQYSKHNPLIAVHSQLLVPDVLTCGCSRHLPVNGVRSGHNVGAQFKTALEQNSFFFFLFVLFATRTWRRGPSLQMSSAIPGKKIIMHPGIQE